MLKLLFRLHSKGIVHGGLTAYNVLLGNDGNVYFDGLLTSLFGKQKFILDHSEFIQANREHFNEEFFRVTSKFFPAVEVVDTVYLAPELHDREDHRDFKTDVFAAGMLMFALLTGRHFFSGQNAGVIMRRVMSTKPSDRSFACVAMDIKGRDSDVFRLARQLDGLMHSMTHVTPYRRCSTADAVLQFCLVADKRLCALRAVEEPKSERAAEIDALIGEIKIVSEECKALCSHR
jgi:serine/threonine protein kinase